MFHKLNGVPRQWSNLTINEKLKELAIVSVYGTYFAVFGFIVILLIMQEI